MKLREVLKKHGLEHLAHHCMKTSISMFKQHYLDICNKFDDIKVINDKEYDVEDIFYHEYVRTHDADLFGVKVASYIKGWWSDVLEGGLA